MGQDNVFITNLFPTNPTMMVGRIHVPSHCGTLEMPFISIHFFPGCDWTLSFVKIRRLVNNQVSTSQATARGHRSSSSKHSSYHLNPTAHQALMDLFHPDNVAVLPYL